VITRTTSAQRCDQYSEALRMVPGIEVARMNNHTWNISARGFNTRWSTKLLVLMDGAACIRGQFGRELAEQDTMLPTSSASK